MEQDKKQRIKAIFDSYDALVEERKQLNAQLRDLIAEASDIMEVKKPHVRKTFAYMKKLNDDGDDELDVINTIFVELKE